MSNLNEVLEVLDSFKVEDVQHIDVSGASSLFDHMVVCSARSSQHAKTAAERVRYHFKPNFSKIPGSDGEEFGEWIVVDLDDVILHIMLPEQREKYSLEELWLELKKISDETKD